MKKKSLVSSLLLLLVAAIWGTAFVAQKDGMDYIGTFTFNFTRNVVGALFLLLLLPLLDKLRSRDESFEKGTKRNIWLGGVCCGIALFVASSLQQYGIAIQDPATNVGKAGFITACYCALVPILGIFLKKKSPWLVWLGAAVAVVGFFFLCLMDGIVSGQGLGLGLSDLMLLGCAICFAVHILVIDHFTALADGVRLSCIQFSTCALLSMIFMFILEAPTLHDITRAWLPILYAGIMSSGVAYTLQIVTQKNVHPAIASLIMSLESVFSVLAGWLLMPESSLSSWELLGCVIVFAAVLMVNLAPHSDGET